MSDNKIVSLKLADKKKDKTLIEVLEQIIQDWKDEDNQDYNDFRVGALIVEMDGGMRVIPLKDETTYHYIGMVEVAKTVLVNSLYDDYEEDQKIPIYEFYCDICDITEERMQKMDDDSVPICKFCNFPMDRHISICGWDLKGEGWFNPHNPKKPARKV